LRPSIDQQQSSTSREALRAAPPLVAREEETELLQRWWEQAKAGDGQVVLIAAEPGIGKSRIAQTVLERCITSPCVPLAAVREARAGAIGSASDARR
jgi:predicted ATP-dependent serine protease